jgi:tetratricopeptide (TPR) repeat protein
LNHPESPAVPAAMLGRGLARLSDPKGTDDAAGVTDLRELTKRMVAGDPPSPATFTATVTSGLNVAATSLAARGNAGAALELLDCQQQLSPTPTAGFFHQLSGVFEARAGQVERGATPEATAAGDRQTAADVARRAKDVRALLIHAADASVAEARLLTMSDDKGYGQALWHGIDLYDRAADGPASIEALQLFVAERPSDPLAPTALLRLGRAYQSAGLFDKAIATYQRNQFLYPNSLAASKSAVPLAAAYMARGPADYPRAEAVLRNVLEGNPLLTPEADEYRQALFELGHLYYRTEQYDKSIARLGEFTTRYTTDERYGQALFLTADSYRKSANLLAAKATADGPTTRPSPADLAEATAARRERLELARNGYDGVVAHFTAEPPKSELDRTYNKLAHFARADCLYDTGRYEEAIRQYDAAAFRYKDDPTSLAAYVQIINAYNALGKPDEAHAANERAMVMLRQMPSKAFSDDMPKEYWANQLRWNSGAATF